MWSYVKKQVYICRNANAAVDVFINVSVDKKAVGRAVRKILVKRLSHDKTYSPVHFTDEAQRLRITGSIPFLSCVDPRGGDLCAQRVDITVLCHQDTPTGV